MSSKSFPSRFKVLYNKYKLFQPKISPYRKYIIMPKQSENHSLQPRGSWGVLGDAETFFRMFI